MPRKFGRRKFGRRRRYGGGGGGFAAGYRTVSKYTNWPTIWGAIKDIKSMINVERKFCDVTSISQVVNKTAALTLLNPIAEGSDYNQRTGISVKTTSLFMRFNIQLDPSAVLNTIRYILFVDKENHGATPAAADVLEDATNYQSPINHVASSRWLILADKFVTLDVNGKAVQEHKLFKKIQFHLKYSATGATTVYNTAIYLLLVADNNTNPPLCSWYSRLRYVDN